MTTIFMKTKYTTLFLLMAIALGSSVISNNVIAGDNHGKTEQHNDSHAEEKAHGDEHGEEEGHVEITATNAIKAGIVNATATSGQINKMTTVYGRTIINPNSISQVSARFPGLITKLTVNVGDFVKAGDNVVQVESSNSLKRYNITAPISGVVTQRLANPGELANQQTLLTLESYEQLWVEYKIFPSQRQTIKTG